MGAKPRNKRPLENPIEKKETSRIRENNKQYIKKTDKITSQSHRNSQNMPTAILSKIKIDNGNNKIAQKT
eukprot:snap_masked-scaffold_81-processed-gene-0.19-mRNA-1 protein AED:1.00 eAED:1.00 QI:0/0/0/0/1/1/2/0/69